jgi:hypothetical protein
MALFAEDDLIFGFGLVLTNLSPDFPSWLITMFYRHNPFIGCFFIDATRFFGRLRHFLPAPSDVLW